MTLTQKVVDAGRRQTRDQSAAGGRMQRTTPDRKGRTQPPAPPPTSPHAEPSGGKTPLRGGGPKRRDPYPRLPLGVLVVFTRASSRNLPALAVSFMRYTGVALPWRRIFL